MSPTTRKGGVRGWRSPPTVRALAVRSAKSSITTYRRLFRRTRQPKGVAITPYTPFGGSREPGRPSMLSLEGILERDQHDAVYAAEAQAAQHWVCFEEPFDLPAMQDLADRCLDWAKSTLGVRSDLTVTVEAEPRDGNSVAEVTDLNWGPTGPTAVVRMYRTEAPGWDTAHWILHEMAHVIVGKFDGALPHPGPHSALFARRYLDLFGQFHPDCYVALVNAFNTFGVEVADYDTVPGSWWDLPTVAPADIGRPTLLHFAHRLFRWAAGRFS